VFIKTCSHNLYVLAIWLLSVHFSPPLNISIFINTITK